MAPVTVNTDTAASLASYVQEYLPGHLQYLLDEARELDGMDWAKVDDFATQLEAAGRCARFLASFLHDQAIESAGPVSAP